MQDFLPVTKKEMKQRGWNQVDFAYITGDAYVDHPSFGTAIISRLLESRGYKVGIISQPDWKKKESIQVFGEPRLGFLVSAGNMDSMVNHYSVSKRRREKDSYTPGGVMGKRPDYATVVYCNLIRSVYKKAPIIIGGIEASLRRLAHYDYWSGKVKHSILVDSQADLISYGMGERSIVEIADALASGIDIKDITFIDGTVYKTDRREAVYDAVWLPSYDQVKENKRTYAESFFTQYQNTDAAAMRAASEMVEAGADPASVSRAIFQNRTLPSVRLEGIAVERMTFGAGGAYALSWLSCDDFEATGAVKADAEPIIDALRSVAGVRVACMLREQGDVVRGSLRAKDDTDVAAVARSFGGGGHVAAAGFTLSCTLDEARRLVDEALAATFASDEEGACRA